MTCKANITGSLLSLFIAVLIIIWSTDLQAGKPQVRRKPAYNPQAARMVHRLPGSILPRTDKEAERKPSVSLPPKEGNKISLKPPIKPTPPIRRLKWAELKEEQRTTVSQQQATILFSDTKAGSVERGRWISEFEILIDKERKVNQQILIEGVNAPALQKRTLNRLLGGVDKRETIYLPKNDAISSSVVLQLLGKQGFMTRSWSDEETFNNNIKRLENREGSSRVRIFDYAPKSDQALLDMDMQGSNLKQWQKTSKQIEKSAASGQLRKNEPIEQFFKTLREESEGTVFIIFGHSDGKSFWFDTGKERIQISREDVERELAGVNELPVLVLLNCETSNNMAPVFLNAGSPLVFTSPSPLPVTDVKRFMKKVLKKVNEQEVDGLDAIYDTLKEVPLPNFGPISFRSTWSSSNLS